jgi:transcriptional regulator with XRE-family HTH domain
MGFGLEFKRLREEAPISAQKIADLIGVDAGRLRKWEEKDLTPRIEDAQKIETFFGLTLDQITKLRSIKKFLKVPQGTTKKAFISHSTEDTEAARIIANADQEDYLLRKQSLEKSIENLTQNELRTTALIERLVALLEKQSLGMELPARGSLGHTTYTPKTEDNL